MKDIKAQAKNTQEAKVRAMTGQKLVHSAHDGYAKGGNAKPHAKKHTTQVNVIVPQKGADTNMAPMSGAMPKLPLPAPTGMPPLGGVAGPMKRGGRAHK